MHNRQGSGLLYKCSRNTAPARLAPNTGLFLYKKDNPQASVLLYQRSAGITKYYTSRTVLAPNIGLFPIKIDVLQYENRRTYVIRTTSLVTM